MMRTDIILVLILFTLTLVSCDRRPVNDEPLWTMTAEQRDSATFARTRHFQTGYNFLVTSDSLPLYAEIPSFPSGFISADSVMVYAKEPLVVAEVRRVPAEGHPAYWIKVARDQSSMGWTSESHLMRSVVPVDPISRFIHAFSNRRLVAGAVILACMSVVMFYRKVRRGQMRMVLFRDIRSFYPTALCHATAVAAVLYRSVLAFSHDAWTAFYYEPSLNPFLWPPLLGAFLACVWLWLVLLLAACDDIRRQLAPWPSIIYFLGIMSVCLFLYLFFSILPSVGLCYICLPPCAACFVWQWHKRARSAYVCGRCGQPMEGKGRCPRCGAVNT